MPSASSLSRMAAAVRSAAHLSEPSEFVEIDVHRSADGALVVIHDSSLERTTTGRGKVAELTWDAIRAHGAGYPEEFGEHLREQYNDQFPFQYTASKVNFE